MAITVANVITDVRVLIDDTADPADATFLIWANQLRRELAKEALCVKDEYSLSTQAYVYKYDLSDAPWTVYKVNDIIHKDIDNISRVDEVGIKEWNKLDISETDTVITKYNEENRTLRFWPRMSSAAATDTLNGAITDSSTTFTLDDTSDFATAGKIKIDSEVIYYSNKTSTTFTGCVRAREGTTAASHSDGATVTERDILITCFREPADLATVATSLEQVFELNYKMFVYYLAWQSALVDIDGINNSAAMGRSREFERLFLQKKRKFISQKTTSQNRYPTIRCREDE